MEFDSIKIFYHLDAQCLYRTGSFTFYIARLGLGPRDCIDWRKENTKITAMGPNREWSECLLLKVPGGAQIRIHYCDQNGVKRSKDCLFPIVLQPLWPGLSFIPPSDPSTDPFQL